MPALCRVTDYAEWLRAIDRGGGIGRKGGAALLEGGQECQKCIVRLEAGQGAAGWGQFPQCLLFHPEVSLNVTMGRFQAFVSEPKRDNSYIDTGLEGVHRRGMSDDMRRDSLCLQARTGGNGSLH